MSEPEVPHQPSDRPPTSASKSPAETQPFIATLQGVWERIKHHKVVQWTLAYLAIAYTLLHGAEMLAGSLSWPHGWIRLFTLILILGVPIVVTLAWYHGSRGQQRVSGTEIMVIGILLAIGGAILWRDDGPDHTIQTDSTSSPLETGGLTDEIAIADKTIAVLPFVNMSSDKEQEYFSDGLSEELLNLLAKIPELRVAARTSSFHFKDKDMKLPDIARELQVAHLLEGSVRKSGDRVRITAQLIRGSDGYHQWSKTYDRTLMDIFGVQEEIAAAVVSQLKITLLGAPIKARATNPDAYAIFLQAFQIDRLWEGRYEESNALYRKVLQLDPTYAPAWLGLGSNYVIQADNGLRPQAEAMEEAREMFKKAITIDPQYGLAYACLGNLVLTYDLDLEAASQLFQQALALSPTDLYTLAFASNLNVALGRQQTAISLGEYFVSRDPLDPGMYLGLGDSYQEAGRYDEAIASFRRALKLSPDMEGTHGRLGDALFLKGDYDGALKEFESESQEPYRLAGLSSAHYYMGNRPASDAALAELIAKHGHWANVIAIVFALRQDRDRAFEWLDRAATVRDSLLTSVSSTVWLKELHDDPRWLPFLRKLGRAPEQVTAIKFELKVPTH